ncbi:hypothetical protein LPJ77_000079 [Coemansia sp. RSA 2523]|nr:hypothetical protein LPJ77_000079 [Coemansia sp. RSA 2523]KAJ2575243.1 hypothetical protein GGH19_003168 [Coemansia sp. RSA 1807]
MDPRIKTFKLEFPLRKPSTGLKPMRTYHGRVEVEVSEPIAINQLRVQFEGWERIDFGSKIGATRKLVFRSTEDLLQGGGVVIDTIAQDAVFDFACTMPNVNFPSAMQSTICEISYSVSASLVGSTRPAISGSVVANSQSRPVSSCANHIVPLATFSVPVQLTPKVLPSGVGWLKPMVMRDGVMLAEPVRRRFRRHTVQTAMNICVQVRNHCCTLGEAISVDVDATMLQKDRVLTFVRAAVIEQVALKTQVEDIQALESINAFVDGQGGSQASTVILAERTLNRKVSEIDPSALSGMSAKDWGASSGSQPLLGLDGVQNLRIRVPRRDVCTSEGFFLKFSHVLRLTFGLTSRPSNGRFDTKYATKDVPLRLVTSKFGDVGRMSQVEINRRLSALTTESDGSMVSEAYGYLLSENSRAVRPTPLEAFTGNSEIPSPSIVSIMDPSCRPYTPGGRPMSSGVLSTSSVSPDRMTFGFESCGYKRKSLVPSATPSRMSGSAPPMVVDSTGFECRPLPPLPKPSHANVNATSVANEQEALHGDALESEEETALYMVRRQSSSKSSSSGSSCRAPNRDTLVNPPPDSVCAESSNDLEPSQRSSSHSSSASLTSSCGSQQEFDADDTQSCPSKSLDALYQRKHCMDGGLLVHSAEFTVNREVPSKLTISNKRGSAQSEGETIVHSPRSYKSDEHMFETRYTPDTKPVMRPELPALPVMAPLGEMTMGMLSSSPTFDENSFSSYWNARTL